MIFTTLWNSNIMFSAVLAILVLIIVMTLRTKSKDNGYKPIPGPWGLPFIGNLHQIGTRPYETFNNMKKLHGDVFLIYFMSKPVLVLNNYKAIRDAFIGQGSVFAGRPSFPSWKHIANDHSLTFNSFSDKWRAQKKVSAHALFLLNSDPEKPLDKLIDQHSDALIACLQKKKTSDPHDAIQTSIAEIIFTMLFGTTIGHENFSKEVLKYYYLFHDIFDEVGVADAMPNFAQIFMRKTLQKMTCVTKGMDNAFETMIGDYRKEYDGQIKTTADAYLKVSSEIPVEGLPDGLTREHVMDSMQDIVGASLETTLHTMYFALRYMIQYPEIQQRAQQEIDSVLGNIPVSFEYRSRLPYVEAIITEVLRHSSVLPLAIPHCTTQDTVFRGHFIPKDTMVLGNIYAANFDDEIWDSPENFAPERFLTPDGEFDKQSLSKLCMFGLGKRRCLGEAIANKMIFVIFAKLLQNCSFNKVQPIEDNTTFHLSLKPVSYLVTVNERSVVS